MASPFTHAAGIGADAPKGLWPKGNVAPVMVGKLAGTVEKKGADPEKIIDNKRFTCYYIVCKIAQGSSGFSPDDRGVALRVPPNRRQVEMNRPEA